MYLVHAHAHNSAHTELLSKEVSTHRSTSYMYTALFIQTQETDVLIIAQ